MHIDQALLPAGYFWPSLLLTLLPLLIAVRSARWSALRDQPGRIHIVAGGAVGCLALWLLNIHLIDGLILHLLGVTTFTLAVGWCFAVIGGCVALVGFSVLQSVGAEELPISMLLTVILPASLSWLLARSLHRPSLRHPFVYMLGAGFVGGALVVMMLALTIYVLFALQGLDEWTRSARDYWPMLPLLMFSEGFINGMCVSALSIFHPDAMKTFDDDFYLGG